MKVDKNFLKNNPIDKISSAYFSYLMINMKGSGNTLKKLTGIAEELFDDSRREEIMRERERISSISSGEELVDFMRRNKEIPLRYDAAERGIELGDEAVCAVVKAYYRQRNDFFIETAAILLYKADESFLTELRENYKEIRSPYAAAQLCLVLAMRGLADDDFLLREYNGFKRGYPDECFSEFPLLGLYINHNMIDKNL